VDKIGWVYKVGERERERERERFRAPVVQPSIHPFISRSRSLHRAPQ